MQSLRPFRLAIVRGWEFGLSKMTTFGPVTVAPGPPHQIPANASAIVWDQPDSGPTDAVRSTLAGDLARKHGLSLDRAAMLVDRFGDNRHALEGAAQALRTRMD